MSNFEPTVFSKIVDGDIPADVVRDTPRVLAFRDIQPQAPVHIVVIPKSPAYRNVVELAAADPGLLAEMVAVARDVADEFANGEFRLVFNSGEQAGQTVFHAHAHVLAGGLTEGSLASG